MPYAAPTPCRKPGCVTSCIAPYCPAHEAYGDEQANAVRRRLDAKRGNSNSRGYGRRWREGTRERILRRDPVCKCTNEKCTACWGRGCRHGSRHVDHITSRIAGGSDDDDNLQGLCGPCHSYKTATEDGGFGRQRKG